jgi:hypothetical protein
MKLLGKDAMIGLVAMIGPIAMIGLVAMCLSVVSDRVNVPEEGGGLIYEKGGN